MRSGMGRARLGGAAAALLAAVGCSTQPAVDAVPPVVPSAQPSVAATGPGTYVAEAVNTLRMPVDVEVVIPADPSVPPTPSAAAAGNLLRRAAAALGGTEPALRYVLVEIDNTGQLDPVPLPENVDILDSAGRGANFRPAYAVLRNRLDVLLGDTPESRAVARAGAALLQDIVVRDGLVRPGQTEVVTYVSEDPLADVATVVVNGSLGVKQP